MPLRTINSGMLSRHGLQQRIAELERDLHKAQAACQDAQAAREHAIQSAAEAWAYCRIVMRTRPPGREE